MVLRKQPGSGSSSSILGLKVVGGKLLENGSMGAVIEKVKKGSTADIEGQLRPGKTINITRWPGTHPPPSLSPAGRNHFWLVTFHASVDL